MAGFKAASVLSGLAYLALAACGSTDEPAVALVSNGVAPRVELRYVPALDAVDQRRVSVELAMRVTRGKPSARPAYPSTLPPLELAVEGRVSQGGDNEDGPTYVLVVDQVYLDEGLLRTPPLRTLERRQSFGARGLNPKAAVTTSPGAGQYDASVGEVLDLLGIPFPVDPVGVGAQWTATETVRHHGFDHLRRIEYTLDSYDTAGATLRLTMTKAAEPQRLDAFDGVSAHLEHFEGTGELTLRVAFDRLIPTTLSGTLTTRMAYRVGGATGLSMSTVHTTQITVPAK